MSLSNSSLPGETPRIGVYAIVRSEEPVVLLAEDVSVMSRLLALHLVAQLPASEVTSKARLKEMRDALLEERWADALVVWIEETGIPVDVYEEVPRIWTKGELAEEQTTMEIRVAPLFSD
jgi:hypothetical protein